MKAFPSNQTVWDEKTGYFRQVDGGGMDLRDYFAAKAMQALITHYGAYCEDGDYGNDYKVPDVNKVSEYCYVQADAMLEERNK